MSISSWWVRRFRNNVMSNEWLQNLDLRESKQGWEGPRWRFPAEQKEEQRRNRLLRIVELRSSDARNRKRA